ncbi:MULTISPECIES: TonB-dependent receptor [unclassified Phenylobacterium]|uniref:TonB-dependent receptor n=1 Tax=unclassified Phenylobacterium TaxID=2640670 RepID=UPI00083A58BD|nr:MULTISPECIES: TonB-dependent receptor [unclassified Phenylobacterium]
MRRRYALVAAALLLAASPARAEDAGRDAEVEALTVWGRALDVIGIARSGSEGLVGYEDLQNRPLLRVGEMVENVPGLIATQHSGTGKANQYFLRGFNLDHGTDLSVSVDGAPVNMRTHAHGQGYLDLNFIIPELVERIAYRKGPYAAETGDFSTAGSIAMKTYDRPPSDFAQATAGEFGYGRALVAGGLAAGGGDVLLGLEVTVSNGPWVLDEDLEKVNLLAKFTRPLGGGDLRLSLSGYRADWTATDQIPQRAIRAGLIPRNGYVDPDLGGRSRRWALTANYEGEGLEAAAYAIRSRFRLTSNFTYVLENPDDGDEFQQAERRTVYGASLRRTWRTRLAGAPTTLRVGVEGRYDDIGRIGLYRSIGGRAVATVREDAVDEYSVGGFVEAEAHLTPTLRAIVGLRADVYGYDVRAGLPVNGGDGSDTLAAPKVALAWRVAEPLELYANYGESFHSNDVRGAAIRIDPATGEPADRVDLLARAKGAELGARYERGDVNLSLVAFWLDLDSELVFVGDAGGTEPNAASRRYGAEASAFWRAGERLTFDLSAAYTHARLRGVAAGEDRIPQSVSVVAGAGATARLTDQLTATLRVRRLGTAPLTEDGSVFSQTTTLLSLGAYYTVGRLRFGLDVYNLLDSQRADITYFYESRLPGEAAGVPDIHLHPVEPRQVRASLRVEF